VKTRQQEHVGGLIWTFNVSGFVCKKNYWASCLVSFSIGS